MIEVGAIVLAAGRATRFGAAPDDSKVVAILDGKPLVRHVVDAALASRARPLVVVTGQAARRVAHALEGAAPLVVVHNRDFALGMAGSLRAGLAALPPAVDGALVLLADMPRVSPRTLDTLIEAFAHERPDAVVPSHDGRRGNPVLLGRTLFPAVEALQGDEGARRLLAGAACHLCVVDDPGVLTDIDDPAALARARAPT